jgi:hypothetical protein
MDTILACVKSLVNGERGAPTPAAVFVMMMTMVFT